MANLRSNLEQFLWHVKGQFGVVFMACLAVIMVSLRACLVGFMANLRVYLELFLWPVKGPFEAVLWAYYMSYLAIRTKGVII